MEIGERIREIRKAKGITQVALSKKTGLSQSSISDIERLTNNPSASTLKLIAGALGCSVYDLVETDEKRPSAQGEGPKDEVFKLLDDLSPAELQRVRDFVSGIKSSRGE